MLLRKHGGYAGVSDSELLRIPYARLLQELRLAGEARASEERELWRRSAFVGWQVTSAVRGMMGGKTPSFDTWLRMFNLHEGVSITEAERLREIEKGRNTASLFDKLASERGLVKA